MKRITALCALMAPCLCAASLAAAQSAPAQCDAKRAQSFVSGPATQESGAAIMKASGARVFQWVFEGSPVTMDFRPERVRVVYNRAMKVVAITCG